MGLKRDVVMSNGLTFELHDIFLWKFHGSRRVTRKYSLQNFMGIGWELTEKSAKNMRYKLIWRRVAYRSNLY